jgi:hypothetical protein
MELSERAMYRRLHLSRIVTGGLLSFRYGTANESYLYGSHAAAI